MLSEDDLDLVDEATIRILERTGVAVYEKQSLAILEKNGASVDKARSRVKIPQGLVRDSLEKKPKKFRLGGRAGRPPLSMGSGNTYFTNSLQGINVLDLKTGATRQSMLSDVADFAKVVDALGNIDFFGVTVVAHDVPGEFHYVKELATSVENTSKHIEHGCHGTEMAKGFIRIAQIASGGEEAFRKEPAVSCFGCPVSPLQFDGPNTEAMVECARAGMPYDVLSMAMSGASAPMSLAGTLAIINAEVLAGTVICELLNPGTPVIYGSVASIMDMRTGVMALGAPERPIINTAVVELAHYYGFPSLVGGISTDGKMPGEQVMMEKVMTGLPPLLARSDVVFGAALLCSATTYSIEQLVIDNEAAGALRRIGRGMEVTPETIALEAVEKAGPGGSFLAMKHTMEHLRRDIWIPELVDRNIYDNWLKLGAKDLRAKAKGKALEILQNHVPKPLDNEQKRDIDRVVLDCSHIG